MGQVPFLQRLSRRLPVALRELSVGELIVWSSWCGLLLSLESVGHRSSEEWLDFGAALALLLWTASTTVVHQARPLQVIRAVSAFLPARQTWLRPLVVDWGVDLRRSPPIRRQLPRAWCLLAAAIFWVSLGIAVFALRMQAGLRDVIASRLYLAYLVPWTLLVGLALFLMSVLSFLIWAELQDPGDSRKRSVRAVKARRQLLIALGMTGVLFLGGGLLPAWIPLAGMALVLAGLTVALMLTSRDLVLIWRKESRGRYGAFDGRLFIWFQAAVVIVVLADVVLLLGGTRELPVQGDWRMTPLLWQGQLLSPSRILARLVGWLSLGATCGIGFDALRLAVLGMTFHPVRIARGEGRVLATADSPARRRAEIGCRRKIIRGLESLFKSARKRGRTPGSGLLLGPQHWFILGMRRVEGDEAVESRDQRIYDGHVGPPFHQVFPRLARFHFWQIAAALEIDLIYVEDAVGFRKFVRVLRVLFEIYDMHAAAQRAEERHFVGLPGVRVVIYDVDAGTIQFRDESEPLASQYPEPDYHELDRARVLHVFREREEATVDDPTPGVSNWAPDLSYH